MGFVLSGYVQSDNEVKVCDKVAGDGSITDVPNLKSVLEEADLRLIPHISKAIDENYRRVVVVSNDTDVVALILYYMPRFILAGLSELWVRFGSGNSSRFLPMHQFAYQLGQKMCTVIMKAHILTGCDVTSKVGTKMGALRNDPELYLTQFGEQDYLTRDVTKKAEEYLVKVWQTKAGTKETTFDGLRFESYVGKKHQYLIYHLRHLLYTDIWNVATMSPGNKPFYLMSYLTKIHDIMVGAMMMVYLFRKNIWQSSQGTTRLDVAARWSALIVAVAYRTRVFRLHNICQLSLRMRQLKNYVILFIAKSWRTNSEECVCISSKLHCYPCYSNSERWLVHSREPNNKTFLLERDPHNSCWNRC